MLNVLLFFSSYLGGFLLTFVSSPVFAFVVYEAVYFFHPSKRWWGYMIPDVAYSFYTVMLMFTALALNFKQANQNKLFSAPQIKWVYFILLGYGFASFYAVSPVLHHDALIYFLKLVIIISVAYKLIDTDSKLNYTLWGYIFGSWYIGFLAYQVGRNSGDRVEGIGTVDSPDANGIAAAIAPSLVLCLYYFWRSGKPIGKILFAIAGAFILNGIVLINSRGAFLAIACSIGYFMFFMYFSSFQKRFQKSITILITLIGLVGASVVVDDTFISRMTTMTNTEVNAEQESGSTRTVFWNAAWEMAKDYPMGAGFRGFNYYAPLYIPKNVHTGGSANRTVHSTWFEALTEVGYLGLFLLIMLLYSSFKSTKKCKLLLKQNGNFDQYFKVIAIEASLIAFVVAMTFLNRYRAEILYWCVLYTACAYNIYVIKGLTGKESIEVKEGGEQYGK